MPMDSWTQRVSLDVSPSITELVAELPPFNEITIDDIRTVLVTARVTGFDAGYMSGHAKGYADATRKTTILREDE